MSQVAITADVLVIGGGINGTGIARDAAGRGLRVLLCEKDDLASHTSSASTKLIHGGLRYLEYYEFSLVRKALQEREILMRSAPHLIQPLRFVMPQTPGQRPAWLIRCGLFLYDHLAHRRLLPGSETLSLPEHVAGPALRPEFRRGFAYSDGWVDDARLVVLTAMDAAEKGATILTRTTCVSAERHKDHWLVQLQTGQGDMIQVKARSIVNAAGPWVSDVLQRVIHQQAHQQLRLIKGSHIVVPRLFSHPYAYIFQHHDGRVVFAIPYEQHFTLIGTTDSDYQGDPGEVAIDADEIRYLCELSREYFAQPVSPADVVHTYSGVRPLVSKDDAQHHASAAALTRDYRLVLDQDAAVCLSVYGGKITTYRRLAEEALALLGPLLGNTTGNWTANACLPGGDIDGAHPQDRSVLEFTSFQVACQQQYPWLLPSLLERYTRAYGTRIHQLLAHCYSMKDMGELLLPGLYEREASYLVRFEWAQTVEDILWRRTHLGLHLSGATSDALRTWLENHEKPRH